MGLMRAAMSEVPFALLRFHRAVFVAIDEPALALRARGLDHLAEDLGKRLCLAAHGPGERVTSERAKADALDPRHLSRREGEALVVDHDERAVALDHGTRRREV